MCFISGNEECASCVIKRGLSDRVLYNQIMENSKRPVFYIRTVKFVSNLLRPQTKISFEFISSFMIEM